MATGSEVKLVAAAEVERLLLRCGKPVEGEQPPQANTRLSGLGGRLRRMGLGRAIVSLEDWQGMARRAEAEGLTELVLTGAGGMEVRPADLPEGIQAVIESHGGDGKRRYTALRIPPPRRQSRTVSGALPSIEAMAVAEGPMPGADAGGMLPYERAAHERQYKQAAAFLRLPQGLPPGIAGKSPGKE